jgi:hypothetical protein
MMRIDVRAESPEEGVGGALLAVDVLAACHWATLLRALVAHCGCDADALDHVRAMFLADHQDHRMELAAAVRKFLTAAEVVH